MTKEAWIIAGILTGLAALGLAVLTAHYRGQELKKVTVELAEARAAAAQTETQSTAFQEELNLSQTRIEALQLENQKVAQAQKSLEQEMRSALESKDITISELQGKLTVNILDRILFDSGEAEIKPQGMQVLRQLAGVLKQYPSRQVHVIGHTDNVPIRASSRNRFPSNWELSTARATAAVRFLCEQAGIDPRRLGSVGYGEFHPVAENATPEGRAQNRRIAIVILSEELVGSDAAVKAARPIPPAAVVATNAPTESADSAPAVPAPAATSRTTNSP